MMRLIEDIAVENAEILKFSGEIDFRSTPGFRSMLQAKIKVECPLLLLDMSEVEYIDSGGWGVLIEYWRDAQRYGGEFALVALSDRLMSIFRIIHLDEHLHTFSSLEQAQDFFTPSSLPEHSIPMH
jgi:anti-sigma B factor antagonist